MKTTTVVTKGLAPGSLFKLIFVGLTFSLGFIIIFMGILSLFGISVITINEEVKTGITGFLYSLALAPVFTTLLSLAVWLYILLGIWIYTRFRSLTIRYQTIDE